MKSRLPRSVMLPSGRRVELEAKPDALSRSPEEGEMLFAEALALVESGDVAMQSDGIPITVYALELRDFHALRGIFARAGLLSEEPVEIACRNCDAVLHHAPCAAIEIGPFVDGELNDPELDATLPFGVPHDIPEVSLGRVRRASSVTLEPLTVDDALPLFRALAKPALTVTGDVVRAMGISALGHEKNPVRIGRALGAASEEAWSAVTDLFLAAHYSPRLFSIALCSKCGARNDVDAPYEREFVPGAGEARGQAAEGELPAFDAFADRARSLADEIFAEHGLTDVAFVVEGGVPAVDDGGEPLLGSYVPGSPGDMEHPSRAAEVTVYYKTFRAIWDEDGPYDWNAELEETVSHEVEHHLAYLVGEDPMAEEEQSEIADEALRVVGKRAVMREGVRTLGQDVKDFLARTWPIWLIVAVATWISLTVR